MRRGPVVQDDVLQRPAAFAGCDQMAGSQGGRGWKALRSGCGPCSWVSPAMLRGGSCGRQWAEPERDVVLASSQLAAVAGCDQVSGVGRACGPSTWTGLDAAVAGEAVPGNSSAAVWPCPVLVRGRRQCVVRLISPVWRYAARAPAAVAGVRPWSIQSVPRGSRTCGSRGRAGRRARCRPTPATRRAWPRGPSVGGRPSPLIITVGLF